MSQLEKFNAFVDSFMTELLGKDWKSTTAGWAGSLLAVAGAVTTYIATQVAAHPNQGPFWEYASGGFTALCFIARVYVGHISKDAGKVVATVPGIPEAVVVDSHEEPDAKGATAVPDKPSTP